MKAQRRHDLETNSLAKVLTQTPEFLRRHGAKVLLGVIIVVLGIILLRQRSNLAEQQVNLGWADITTAQQAIAELHRVPTMGYELAQEYNTRVSLVDTATRAVKAALASDNPHLVAQALVTQGDLYWTLANLPPIAAATTRPNVGMDSTPAEYLEKADASYQKVLQSHKDQLLPVVSARLGLAAIAENRRDWAAAKSIYETIVKDPGALASFKAQAQFRLEHMGDVDRPMYIAPSTRPSFSPSDAILPR